MKIFFLINGGRKPVATTRLEDFKSILDACGHEYQMEVSLSLAHAAALTAEAEKSGYDVLLVGGGDGSINALLNYASDTKLTIGVVPMGTVNALARSLNLPLRPEAALRYLLQAKAAEMDIGVVNESRRFICFASIGFDAAVVHDVGGIFKKLFGRGAYAVAGARAVLSMSRITGFVAEFGKGSRLQPTETPVFAAGSNAEPAVGEVCEAALEPELLPSQKGYSLLVSNIRNYAGLELFHGVEPCSGLMECWLFRQKHLTSMAGWAAACALRLPKWQRKLEKAVGHYQVDHFRLRSEQRMFLQLDGESVELGDNREFRFECRRGAIRMLI